MKKHPITIVLTEETHLKLKEMSAKESRPVAQMVRVIIEQAVSAYLSPDPRTGKRPGTPG